MKKYLKRLPIIILVVMLFTIGSGVALATTIPQHVLDTNISATITVSCVYNLTVNAGANGSVTGSRTNVPAGSYPITATANSGYVFVGWSGDTSALTDANSANTNANITNSNVTVTANFAKLVNLYSDLQCTIPVTSLDFGSILTIDSPVTKVVYFKSTKGAEGQDYSATGEVDPATIAVTNNINTAVATFSYIVGTPFSAAVGSGGSHPCMITLTVTPVGAGTSSFNIHVTGHD